MNYYLTLAIILFGYMNLWFIASLYKRRNDIADIAWGFGFVLLSWSSFLISENYTLRSLIVSLLVSLWGLRLAWHIQKRNKGKKEDYRYLAWRKEWGKWFYLRSYFQVYLLQGLFLFIISLPFLYINKNVGIQIGLWDFIGIAVWLIGFLFETIGDAQLLSFVKNPENKGKLMTGGLWKYTRHPNYFGEVLLWWGLWIMTLSLSTGFYTVVGPITITILILKVSGIPMLEKKMSEHKDFLEYKKSTSVFIPWFKKY